ncbi:uncharacterized protein LOC134189562 [Corticium candelabrum]|uniref:uncharacterized protein LOC134189562 n=1 Tax=Corticium candelabrum TaxID=121492 RepID=UPI002E261DF9|nr:uncharacterized protein LOC134189562 [Corticium candelabrum]
MSDSDDSTTLGLRFLLTASQSVQSWNPVLASYFRIQTLSRSVKDRAVTDSRLKIGRRMCQYCGTFFNHSGFAVQTRIVSMKRTRKIRVCRKQLYKYNHWHNRLSSSPHRQKELCTVLAKKCLTCCRSAFLPIGGMKQTDSTKQTEDTLESGVIPVKLVSKDQGVAENKCETKKKRRSSIHKTILNMKRTSSGGSPLLKDFLSSI